jgi:hypothetical protein
VFSDRFALKNTTMRKSEITTMKKGQNTTMRKIKLPQCEKGKYNT